MENVYFTALYKAGKRLGFLLDFCIENNREKNLVVWPRLYMLPTRFHQGLSLITEKHCVRVAQLFLRCVSNTQHMLQSCTLVTGSIGGKNGSKEGLLCIAVQ